MTQTQKPTSFLFQIKEKLNRITKVKAIRAALPNLTLAEAIQLVKEDEEKKTQGS